MYNIFLLSACNLRCEYCFADEIMGRGPSQKTTRGSAVSTMSLENYAQILDFLTASQIPIVSLVGGEPTLHPEYIAIVKMSLEKGFSISIKSNATWNEKIRRAIQLLPDEGVHYLLNINHPAFLGPHLWGKVVDNARALKGRHVDFQLNIDCVEFEYQYILDLANEVGVSNIVWSLSNLVKGDASDSLSDPIAIREKYSKRLLAFIVEAGKHGILTVGVHGITPCMFSDQDYDELLASGGSLKSTCNPVFDFLPDLSILYCFPMSGFWEKKYIYDYSNLGELKMEFQETLAFMRSDSYPMADCSQCDHFYLDLCYGGCIAQHLNRYDKTEFDDVHFLDRVPLLTKNFRVEKRAGNGNVQLDEMCYLLNTRSGENYEIDRILYSLLDSVDGQKSFGALFCDAFPKFEENSAGVGLYKEVVTQLLKRGVLRLKPFTKIDPIVAASLSKD